MQPAGVVPALDVLEDGPSKPGSVGHARVSMSSRLMVAKNDLGHRVVPALALASDREDDAVGPGELGEVTARILLEFKGS